jgi:hypothetical protein
VDQQNSSSLDQLDGKQAFPRLSINHLLLLMLTVSFSLACAATDFAEELRRAPAHWKWIAWGILTDAMAAGVKLFGLIVLVRGWLRGQKLAMAPGHWFFLVVGPIAFANLVCLPLRLLPLAWEGRYFGQIAAVQQGVTAATYLVGVALCTIGVMKTPSRRWKIGLAMLWVLLACITVVNSSWAIRNLSRQPQWFSQHLIVMWAHLEFVFAVSFLIAAIIDGTARLRRDWLHYLALVAILLDSFTAVVSFGPTLGRCWASAIGWLFG